MSYLLDTNVISELVKPKPAQSVVDWISSIESPKFFMSVITLGEIRKGINGIAHERRKNEILNWLEKDLPAYFEERILAIDAKVADTWGRLQGENAYTLPAIDGLIAATALTFNLKLVTRNTKDFINTPVELVNPWDKIPALS